MLFEIDRKRLREGRRRVETGIAVLMGLIEKPVAGDLVPVFSCGLIDAQ